MSKLHHEISPQVVSIVDCGSFSEHSKVGWYSVEESRSQDRVTSGIFSFIFFKIRDGEDISVLCECIPDHLFDKVVQRGVQIIYLAKETK